MYYLELSLAIAFELAGTNLMKISNGFTRLWPAIGTLVAYSICFYCFSLSLRGIKLTIAYATWGGVGIVLASLLSFFIFHEHLTAWQVFGVCLVVSGVVITNLAGNR